MTFIKSRCGAPIAPVLPLAPRLPQRSRLPGRRPSRLRGADFDRTYMNAMVRNHEEARSAEDQNIETFASRTLPMLEAHLQMAKDISARMATSGKGPRE